MRGLNLSRLARASEGSFFKSEQANQASALRKTLSPEEVRALRQRQTSNPSVDVLPEISAQSAYNRLDPPPASVVNSRPAIVSRISSVRTADMLRPKPSEPHIMRALGSGEFSLYQQVRDKTPQAMPLPGGEKYADGAILGMTSFSVATAFVASFGLACGVGVYFNPGVVDYARERTRRFARRMDATLGHRMRENVQKMKQRGPVVGIEQREKLGGLLRNAVGGRELEKQRKRRISEDDKD